ncbi:KamA family radical SAM protein [Scytonema sp. UIC 10036]|uniref:KamA family radical SAM protein n=1 Tax=Scytonema sp. UIC 10036 TaxID=2304196 RepID=UPI0012DA504E|nr:KamA family radical SAM protein [Scytonema sp. UIC 10036]MUG93962.1 KamA family radical SAM protein [Scytonema sp. UIC 10036]
MVYTEINPIVIHNTRRQEICRIFGETYDPERWNDWRWQMRHRLTKPEHFQRLLHLVPAEEQGLLKSPEKFAIAVTPHFAALLDPEDSLCPLRLQVIPREAELVVNPADMKDPCGEDHDSVVPGLVHRYPDRVLFLALDSCAAYCRYCTRSRLVSQGEMYPLTRRMEAIVAYLEEHTEVRDVLISGGDPLLMSDEPLDNLLRQLRAISHIEFIRIGSRVPSFLPQRITPELVAVLRKHRVWLSLHFCHVRELTPETAYACDLLADGGIPLGSQTVLLKNVNDSEESLKQLFHGLLKLRVRPYYLYQCDPVVGTAHLRTSVQTGLDLISKLRGHTTGYAVPTYVIDAPGGGGKVPIQKETLLAYENGTALVRNWEGQTFTYTDPEI